MFNSADHESKQQQNEPAKKEAIQTMVPKAQVKSEAPQEIIKGKEAPKMTLPLTAPQVDCAAPLPSDYVQFFVNPNEQFPAKTTTEPVKQLLEQEPTKKTLPTEKAKEQQQELPKEVIKPKADEVQTIASDGVKQRIIKCRNGVPESLIKAIREYMDKQK